MRAFGDGGGSWWTWHMVFVVAGGIWCPCSVCDFNDFVDDAHHFDCVYDLNGVRGFKTRHMTSVGLVVGHVVFVNFWHTFPIVLTTGYMMPPMLMLGHILPVFLLTGI